MHFATVALALLGVQHVAANTYLERVTKYTATPQIELEEEDYQGPAPRAPVFLNSKTKPYSVNGTALPFLPDIGESYAGLLPIDNTGRELFFWFFPSSTGEGAKDITIWLNGGPGCSSLEGLLQENGPVVWRPGTYGPCKNMYAYNKLSNVVYIEQPVGTGYTQGTPNATNEVEVAAQFNAFWKNFVTLFSLQGFNIYITGESYAGQYVPYIGDGMLNHTDTTYYNLKGIIVYDPVIGPFSYIEPSIVPFALYNRASFPFDPSFWATLLSKQESCGFTSYLANGLTYPPKGPLPTLSPPKDCDLYDMVYSEVIKLNPCFDIYQVSTICPTLGNVLGYIASRAPPAIPDLRFSYFDRADVKALLHVNVSKPWALCTGGVLRHDTSPGSAENGGPIMRIAQKIGNVLVSHATQDMILLSNQSLLTLNNLTWNGQRGFNQGPVNPFYVPNAFSKSNKTAGYKYLGQWTERAGITFCEVNLSGHMVPEFQPGAAYRHLEYLLGKVKTLADQIPFS